MKMVALAVLVVLAVGCATKPIPRSRQQQVELATQTGIYSYQRGIGPPRGR